MASIPPAPETQEFGIGEAKVGWRLPRLARSALGIVTSILSISGWVTYFTKTLFTPAGIDFYSRRKEGLPKEAVDGILASLQGLYVPEMKKLVVEVFEIPRN